MSTGKKPDPRKGGRRHAHATHLVCKGGEKFTAWKAGEIFGCPGHRTFAHQPCHSAMTDGKLQCPYCAAGVKEIYRAYVPLWDVDWTLRFCLVGEDIFESVDSVDFRAAVLVTRGKNPISPLIVRPFATLERELPNRSPWDKPVDMLAIALTLWQDDAMTKWFTTNRPAPAVSDKAVSLKSNGEPFGPMTAAAARRFAPPPTVESADKALDKTLAELAKKASKLKPAANGNGNGKH